MAEACLKIGLALAAILVLIVPFDTYRNIEAQGLLILVAGGFSWLGLILSYRTAFKGLSKISVWLLGLFVICCVLSMVNSPHLGYNLLGAPYIRLGALGLISCIGCGLAASQISTKSLTKYLYGGIVVTTILSIPYSLIKFETLIRAGGLFAQADVFACFIGCGIILGFGLISQYPKRLSLLIPIQIFLVISLLITETRAVIVLVILLAIVWQLITAGRKNIHLIWLSTIAVVLLLAGLQYLAPGRLTNTKYASESITYRANLQQSALNQTTHKPILGYGPGNLADALDCSKLSSKDLKETCSKGYFFNSSHNIFIDRILAIGWIGGLAFLALTIYGLYRGFRASKEVKILALALLLISLYYLTNVTSVTLELLFWVLLIKCLVSPKASRA